MNAVKEIPVMTTDRHIDRKQQAALARKLFKSLGLKGISVTTPTYSMASTVKVRLPRADVTAAMFILNGRDYNGEAYSDMPDELPAKIAHAARWAEITEIKRVLAIAFPNHDDRSDSCSDHFDFCWSVG